MKKVIFKLSLFSILYSCSKTESTPPVLFKATAEDSMRLGLTKIGQKFQGGIIAYFLQPGDSGYDANLKHGLIAATEDQSTGIRWQSNLIITRATETGLGTGLSNTIKIIAKEAALPDYFATSFAAGLAKAHNGGGYTDWYLPSKDELQKLYFNRVVIGGFVLTATYWSSSELEDQGLGGVVWVHNFSASYIPQYAFKYYTPKTTTYYVRAIRAF